MRYFLFLLTLTCMAQEPVPEARSRYEKGMERFHREEYKAAVAEFESAIEKDAGFPEAWLRMGFCFGKLGDPRRKVEAFQKAVVLKPDFIEARYELGVAYCWRTTGMRRGDRLRR